MRYLRLLLPILSGLAVSASFPGSSFYFFTWIGLIPFLYFGLTEKNRLSLLFAHLLFGFTYFGIILYWIPRVLIYYGGLGNLVSALLFLLMISILTLFLAPFTFLFHWTAVRKGPIFALLCAPGFWILTEIIRNYFAVGGFPWASLAYSQIPYQVIIQCADIGGPHLVSYLVVTVNCALLALVWRRQIRYGAIVLGVFTLANLYGIYRIAWWDLPVDGSIRVGMLQGCIEVAGSREYYAEKYFEDLPRLFDQVAEERAAFIIIPEAQNPFFYSEDFYFRTFWGSRAKSTGTYILLNSAAFDKEDRGVYYNSAYLIAPDGISSYRYDKNHLVPFGEYLPLESILGKFAEPLVREVSSFTPGKDLTPGQIENMKFGTLICYEGIFPELSRGFVSRGAQILVNITNDAWFGDTAAPQQHLNMAALRSVENRRPLLRAANSGYSARINPLGKILNRTDLFKEQTIVTDVQYSSYRTLYSYIGEWISIAVIIVTLALAIQGTFKKKESISA